MSSDPRRIIIDDAIKVLQAEGVKTRADAAKVRAAAFALTQQVHNWMSRKLIEFKALFGKH